MNDTLPYCAHYGGTKCVHRICVTIGCTTLYFSYATLVAFRHPAYDNIVCSENVWGCTTGRHLNMLQPDKAKRVPRHVFEAQWRDLQSQVVALRLLATRPSG